MYGSSLMRVTLRPRDSRIAAREAEAIPLPREDTTPPVTKTNLVMSGSEAVLPSGGKFQLYGPGNILPHARPFRQAHRARAHRRHRLLQVGGAVPRPGEG